MEISEAQMHMLKIYGERDRRRGAVGTALWLCEEVGELLRAIRKGENVEEEFADVLAWLLSLANVVGVDANKAFIAHYGSGCKKCKRIPCECTR